MERTISFIEGKQFQISFPEFKKKTLTRENFLVGWAVLIGYKGGWYIDFFLILEMECPEAITHTFL